MPTGPTDPPPTRSPKLLDGIETAAQELMRLHPGSPHPKAIADAVAELRKAMRAPLPAGWAWDGDGNLCLFRRGFVASTFTNGRWMIFNDFGDRAEKVKRGKAKDEERARVAVEDWFWANGWPK